MVKSESQVIPVQSLVELGVIHVAMKLDVVFTESMSKREQVNDEQEGPKYRTLRYTRKYVLVFHCYWIK